uniref:Uncharacterized protein n=1 Tax=Arundo donax TaxID=35708 RepID=A0A0A9H4D0_ARUDO
MCFLQLECALHFCCNVHARLNRLPLHFILLFKEQSGNLVLAPEQCSCCSTHTAPFRSFLIQYNVV